MKLPGAKRDEAFGVGMKGSGSTRGRLCQAGSKRVGGLFPGYPVSGKETDAESGGYRHDPREADRLLESILVAAKVGTNADGATLYRVTEDGRALRFEIVRNDSLHLAMGGIGRESASLPDVPLMDKHGEPNDSMVAAYAAVHRRTVRVADAYTAAGFDFSGTRSFDQRTGYRSQSILAVPITGIDGETAGVLQLINALDPMTGKVKPFSAEDQRVAESFAAQAGLVVKNKSPPAQAMQRGSR